MVTWPGVVKHLFEAFFACLHVDDSSIAAPSRVDVSQLEMNTLLAGSSALQRTCSCTLTQQCHACFEAIGGSDALRAVPCMMPAGVVDLPLTKRFC
jgi:hypothetical protein